MEGLKVKHTYMYGTISSCQSNHTLANDMDKQRHMSTLSSKALTRVER